MPCVTPPQLGVSIGSAELPPRTHGREQTVSPPVKFTHTPAQSGGVALGVHWEPSGLPVLAAVTHTARRASQVRPEGHWLSLPHVGRQAVVAPLPMGAQRRSLRPRHLFGSRSSLMYMSEGPSSQLSTQSPGTFAFGL